MESPGEHVHPEKAIFAAVTGLRGPLPPASQLLRLH